jgi:hypothetical protein
MLAGVLALAATTFSISLTLIPAAYASVPVSPRQAPGSVGFALVTQLPAHPGLPLRHTVRPGDTLSGLAVQYCHGVANDWTGFYHDNRQVIGADPNRIYPGQTLALNRCTDPPALLHLGSTYHAPRHAVRHAAARSGKIWKVTYGYPYTCGDGDHDGWDRPCVSAQPAHRVYHAATSSRSYSGHYSYAGLEALWIGAGGPAWAAAHAAEIAECESGGNVHAHNPSGATGLWQILGQVVGGNLYNPYVNAANAVAKFHGGGNTFSAWVCK